MTIWKPQVSRREMMTLSAAGVLGAPMSGWMSVLASHAADKNAKSKVPKRCVLLWMGGGPSHKDTFDMRAGGPIRQIKTSEQGIQISEHFPQLARLMKHGAIIRSMSTREGSHGRASYLLHTGYREGVGGLTYPSIGSIASMEIGDRKTAMPNYVTVGGGRAYGPGFLGPRHKPVSVVDANRGLENMQPLVTNQQFNKRVGLLQKMEDSFHRTRAAVTTNAHRTTSQRAVALMQARGVKAFDISLESRKTRDRYGDSKFGQGCLLARRLIEAGVTFVEVGLGGWDTHGNNFEQVPTLSKQVDPAMSALITDLRDRRLLDSTLVIWMGEFGRTPKVNRRGGRDHYPRAWSTVWFGGGIRGGQVVGRTDAAAASVVERPVSTIDYMATICRVLGVNFERENQTAIARPIRIVDRGAKPITELL